MSKFQFIQGKKSPDDRILLYNDVAVTFEDVATMCLFFMDLLKELLFLFRTPEPF